jgi:integrase
MTESTWQPTGIEGLYRHKESLRYYSRFRLNGDRSFRSLKTKVFTVAKLKHAKRRLSVEKDRRRGAGIDHADRFRTLGALIAETEKRLAEKGGRGSTPTNRKNGIERLRRHWQRGDFDTFPARNVTADVIVELREYLLREALWRYHFGKMRAGYGPAATNYALWLLRVALDIAVEKLVIPESPFTAKQVLRESLMAPSSGDIDCSRIPSRPDMMRILAEMRRLPTERFHPNAEQRIYLQKMADEMADHAELMAFSGMRKKEAVDTILEDDRGDELLIRGTKSKSSRRTIPVNPDLRSVLDRLKSRRVGGKTHLVITSEPRPALKRACRRLALPELTNHDLRHFFASACIASGVDIPTISRWLGHADGGALAMRTYGHLLKDHSQAAARKVDFSGARNDARSSVA